MPSRPGERLYRFKASWRGMLRSQALERAGYRCESCGNPGEDGKGKGLQLAHIVDDRLGGQPVLSNVVVLCRPHHQQFDAGKRRSVRR
jgi:predicted restriction endonuclease